MGGGESAERFGGEFLMSVTSLAGTTWTLNDTIDMDYEVYPISDISITANNTTYTKFNASEQSDLYRIQTYIVTFVGPTSSPIGPFNGYDINDSVCYGYSTRPGQVTFVHPELKTFTINSVGSSYESSLITWLEVNATQVIPIPVDYLTNDVELTSIANAIRTKGGTSASLTYPAGFVSAIQNISTGTDVSDTTAVAGDVLTGKYFYTSSGVKTQGTIQSQAAQTITPTTTDQTIASGKYLTGTQTIKGDANLIAENIAKDVTIFGVTGTHEGGGGGGTVTVKIYDYGGMVTDVWGHSTAIIQQEVDFDLGIIYWNVTTSENSLIVLVLLASTLNINMHGCGTSTIKSLSRNGIGLLSLNDQSGSIEVI